MKKILFIVFAFGIIIKPLNAQIGNNTNASFNCSTPNISANILELENIRGLDYSQSDFYIKTYVHVMRKENDPTSGQSLLGINESLKIAFNDYDPLGINLVWDGEIDYIDDDSLYQGGSNSTIFSTNNHTDGLDIYLFDQSTYGSGVANDIGSSSELLLGGWQWNYAENEHVFYAQSRAITHEIGHVFFLYHTHHGYGQEEDDDICKECIDGDSFNRANCGDFIKDTPPDPQLYLSDVDDVYCDYSGGGNDDCGAPFDPDTSNFMSYAPLSCIENFTTVQIKRMKNAIGYLPFLQDTQLQNYVYFRGNSSVVCDLLAKEFQVYSNDVSNLTLETSNNVTLSGVTNNGDNIVFDVNNNIINAAEGQFGWVIAKRSGQEVARRDFWVGKPQAVPEYTLQGDQSVTAGDEVIYEIPERLNGTESYVWDYPGDNSLEIWPFTGDTSLWQLDYMSKHERFSKAQVGPCSGELILYGLNECGEGIEDTLDIDSDDDDCEDADIVYYPNPADDLLQIDLSLQDYKVFDIVVYNNNQVAVYTDQSTNVVKTIDTFNLSNDTYYLHIYDGSELILSKILIINH
tara:strand:- start:18587 stop:20308 length:1722 start_codon:yes stop_codon:yes gene_type:complete